MFGSHALGLERIGSDYDFGILVKDKKMVKDYDKRIELYNALYGFLSEKINKLVNIDIVFLETAPAELQGHVMKHGVPYYEANPHAFARFKEYVMLQNADFEPYHNLFYREILARIPSI